MLGAAALDRVRVAGHRGESLATAEQRRGVRLVLHHEPERQVVAGADLCQHVAEPGRQRVGVHRDGDGDLPVVVAQHFPGLVVEQPDLPAEPDQGRPRLGRLARRAAADDDLADLSLEGADALAHRAGRHAQRPRRGVEGAVIGDGHQRLDCRGVVAMKPC